MIYNISLSDAGDEEVRQAILAPLVEYNVGQAGPSLSKPIAVVVRSDEGKVLGGLWGHTGYQWLFVQLLVVPVGMRRQGLGARIMQLAEHEAVSRGCHGAWLDTFEFQARGFYERIGYSCFGELPHYPDGSSRFFYEEGARRASRLTF